MVSGLRKKEKLLCLTQDKQRSRPAVSGSTSHSWSCLSMKSSSSSASSSSSERSGFLQTTDRNIAVSITCSEKGLPCQNSTKGWRMSVIKFAGKCERTFIGCVRNTDVKRATMSEVIHFLHLKSPNWMP